MPRNSKPVPTENPVTARLRGGKEGRKHGIEGRGVVGESEGETLCAGYVCSVRGSHRHITACMTWRMSQLERLFQGEFITKLSGNICPFFLSLFLTLYLLSSRPKFVLAIAICVVCFFFVPL